MADSREPPPFEDSLAEVESEDIFKSAFEVRKLQKSLAVLFKMNK